MPIVPLCFKGTTCKEKERQVKLAEFGSSLKTTLIIKLKRVIQEIKKTIKKLSNISRELSLERDNLISLKKERQAIIELQQATEELIEDLKDEST